MGKTLGLFLVFAVCAACQTTLRTGDLLFHVVEQGNAITAVTPAMTDHVAIYAGRGMVLEAYPGIGVALTPLPVVLSRSSGHYVTARVGEADRRQSVANARAYIGLPYDSLFLPTTGAVYCSELVQLSYVDRRGHPIFSAIPMSFHDSTGTITPFWQQFYQRHGLGVPEGEPGTNPGELSQRRQVKMGSRIIK
ncbi:MAG: hypothetical protein IJT98_00275 [Prevotella sp.]|nr:hypothetical protein [Prevotella sp.]